MTSRKEHRKVGVLEVVQEPFWSTNPINILLMAVGCAITGLDITVMSDYL